MCGIFGFSVNEKFSGNIQALFLDLFNLSLARGKEASGLAVRYGTRMQILRDNISACSLKKNIDNLAIFSETNVIKERLSLIGHTRLVTNGDKSNIFNNQPVEYDNVVLVHNGIICNYKEIWETVLKKSCPSELDSTTIAAYLSLFSQQDTVDKNILSFYDIMEGEASIASFIGRDLILSTNTGSLYYIEDNFGSIVFASQFSFMKVISKKYFNNTPIKQLKPKQVHIFSLGGPEKINIIDYNKIKKTRKEMKKCSRCILPETFPGIVFDNQGICNICREHKTFVPYGASALENLCKKYKKDDGSPDCVLAFSGGRDSSYMLHYLKCVMGMNPITVTYDWGLVTDLARRNIARMCGKLGVENILVSADIAKKRTNVRLNLKAWLKNPQLGMVTLLMAGDKQFFYYPKKIKEELDIKLLFFGSNSLEQSGFKSGFCGVYERNSWYCDVSLWQKIKIAKYFVWNFLKNKSYFNTSIYDTILSFFCAYFMRHDLTIFYDYIQWNEKTILSTLKEKYNWETDSFSDVTWRIGDGTAAFYNYIYLKMAGFTENDTLRSAQIRNGLITREEAIELIKQDNVIRMESMVEYANLIKFDLEEAMTIIDSASNLYL